MIEFQNSYIVPMYHLISIPLCGWASGQTSKKKSFSRKKEKLSPPFFLSLYKREVISRFFSSSAAARRTSVLLCLIYIFHRLIVIAWILFSISLYKRILVVPLLLDITKLSLSLSVMPCLSAFEICCCVADSVIQTIMLLLVAN